MSAIKPVELGAHMWRELDSTFQHVAQVNDLMRHELRAQLWAGFVSAAAGAMARDLGKGDATVLLKAAINVVASLEVPGH